LATYKDIRSFYGANLGFRHRLRRWGGVRFPDLAAFGVGVEKIAGELFAAISLGIEEAHVFAIIELGDGLVHRGDAGEMAGGAPSTADQEPKAF